MIVVLDASAAVHVLLNGPRAAAVTPALADAEAVVAPDLVIAEVANALWKYVRAGQLDIDRALVALNDMSSLVTELVPVAPLSQETLAEAVRIDHPVYDVAYLVAARRKAATLATFDRRLAVLAEELGIRVVGAPGN